MVASLFLLRLIQRYSRAGCLCMIFLLFQLKSLAVCLFDDFQVIAQYGYFGISLLLHSMATLGIPFYCSVDSQRRTIVTETHRTYTINSNVPQMPQNADYISVDRVDSSYQAMKQSAPTNMFHPVDFVIPTGPIFNYTSAKVVTPSGHTHLPEIVDNGDGSVTIKYQPIETGLHNLHVAYNNKPIEGSPYQFYVDAVDSGIVAAYGPGLSYGVAGEPCSFTIDTKNAGAGGLSLAVEGPSKTEISCHDNHDGTCTVTFVPRVAGEYRASVKVNGQHIPGSPFLVKVQPRPGEIQERSQFSMGTASEFSLTVKEYDINTLTADITTPSGKSESCILKKLPNGHLGISFTPHETGVHLVNVYKDRQHIPGSPFKIDVSRNEVGDASKVRVYGEGLYRGYLHQITEFVVDTRDAGYGGLSLSVEGPSKADITCKDKPDGTCGVTYKPTQPGTYVIAIKFADEHVPGSPFNCKIGGVTTNKEESIVSRTVKVVETTHVGSVCELVLKVPGSDPDGHGRLRNVARGQD
ncbi:FLNB [Bugula neritina]|uniref:FLNB n=1 Tax=Bugula neritina TaxID=10212 RepID=A0A7J7ITU8_BUGNE|nr:FLNB [Bugula neritina]